MRKLVLVVIGLVCTSAAFADVALLAPYDKSASKSMTTTNADLNKMVVAIRASGRTCKSISGITDPIPVFGAKNPSSYQIICDGIENNHIYHVVLNNKTAKVL